jgi:hypothetical protein
MNCNPDRNPGKVSGFQPAQKLKPESLMKTSIHSTLIAIGFILSTVVISLQGERIDRLAKQVERLEKAASVQPPPPPKD